MSWNNVSRKVDRKASEFTMKPIPLASREQQLSGWLVDYSFLKDIAQVINIAMPSYNEVTESHINDVIKHLERRGYVTLETYVDCEYCKRKHPRSKTCKCVEVQC